MTTRKLAQLIGRVAEYRTGEDKRLTVLVRIVDVKTAWGKTRVQVTPTAGSGTVWVLLDSVTLHPAGEGAEVKR